MKFLGKIVGLQLQRSCLKRDEQARRLYDPSPLIKVDRLTLTPTGAFAAAADGSFTIDVHNSAHPRSRNTDGINALSFVFTSHYTAMRERWGNHLTDGCAGESILIETEAVIALPQVGRGVCIETKEGRVDLGNVVVATPCLPFSEYVLRRPGASAVELKTTLQFLNHGLRGFYCGLISAGPATISVGDRFFAAE